MWFGSIERMNAAFTLTQSLMSVPGATIPPRTVPSRFGLCAGDRTASIAWCPAHEALACMQRGQGVLGLSTHVWGDCLRAGTPESGTWFERDTDRCAKAFMQLCLLAIWQVYEVRSSIRRISCRSAPHRVWGLAASSTARMVGSSLYSTPVMVLLRVRTVPTYFWYACGARNTEVVQQHPAHPGRWQHVLARANSLQHGHSSNTCQAILQHVPGRCQVRQA